MVSVSNLFTSLRLSDTAVSRHFATQASCDGPTQQHSPSLNSPPSPFLDNTTVTAPTLNANFSSHVRLAFQDRPTDRTGDLVRLLDDITTVTHSLSAYVAQHAVMNTGVLDPSVATQQLYQSLCHDGYACVLLERYHDSPLTLPENAPHGGYVVMLTALDMCHDMDTVPVCGTIFSIYTRLASPSVRGRIEDLQQSVRAQVAAGYVVYSVDTRLVYTLGNGVHSFQLHPLTSQYFLEDPAPLRLPSQSFSKYLKDDFSSQNDDDSHPLEIYTDYSALRKQEDRLSQKIIAFVKETKARVVSDSCFVADVDAVVRRGGLVWWTSVELLCEAAPMALIVCQMGGVAVDGKGRPILDLAIQDDDVHRKTAFLAGPREFVNEITSIFTNQDPDASIDLESDQIETPR